MSIEEIYRSSPAQVRATHTLESARPSYQPYVDFVSAWVPAGARVLDLGCGTGWSSYLLAERGYRVLGADLNARAFQPPRGERLSWMAASMNHIPAKDGAFDAVCLHEALEHGEDPGQALREMARVARPGGVVVVVGPNLLSPLMSARVLFVYSLQARPRRRLLWRDADTPHHPFGNTVPEAIVQLGRNLSLIARKLANRGEPEFTMRTPDRRPPFHSDNDASYVCNPIDLWRFFAREGFELLATSPGRRPAWTALIAGGTWVAARKPA